MKLDFKKQREAFIVCKSAIQVAINKIADLDADLPEGSDEFVANLTNARLELSDLRKEWAKRTALAKFDSHMKSRGFSEVGIKHTCQKAEEYVAVVFFDTYSIWSSWCVANTPKVAFREFITPDFRKEHFKNGHPDDIARKLRKNTRFFRRPALEMNAPDITAMDSTCKFTFEEMCDPRWK